MSWVFLVSEMYCQVDFDDLQVSPYVPAKLSGAIIRNLI